MHIDENYSNLLKKSYNANIAQFWKYVWLVFIIVHERARLLDQ